MTTTTDLRDFADDRLLPLLQQFVDLEVSKATSPLRAEVRWLKARIVVLETERLKRQREAA